jgi:DNA-binding NtrC family response regulator
VRLVAATNRDLEAMVKKGEFREDLLYRLNVVRLQMPPLRQREDDILPLLQHFIHHFAMENGLPEVRLDEDVLKALKRYRWPGNIRELRNFAENTVVMKRGGVVTVYDLDPRFVEDSDGGGGPALPMQNPLSVEENEKRLLRNALTQAKGNRTKAAELLGVSRRTLHRKLNLWPDLDVRGG